MELQGHLHPHGLRKQIKPRASGCLVSGALGIPALVTLSPSCRRALLILHADLCPQQEENDTDRRRPHTELGHGQAHRSNSFVRHVGRGHFFPIDYVCPCNLCILDRPVSISVSQSDELPRVNIFSIFSYLFLLHASVGNNWPHPSTCGKERIFISCDDGLRII